MSMCFYFVCVALNVGRDLGTVSSSVKGALWALCRITKLQECPRPRKRTIEQLTIIIHGHFHKGPEAASEIYRPSDRRLSVKLVPIFADRGGVTRRIPYGRNLDFLEHINNNNNYYYYCYLIIILECTRAISGIHTQQNNH
jgi:hypothetical protein